VFEPPELLDRLASISPKPAGRMPSPRQARRPFVPLSVSCSPPRVTSWAGADERFTEDGLPSAAIGFAVDHGSAEPAPQGMRRAARWNATWDWTCTARRAWCAAGTRRTTATLHYLCFDLFVARWMMNDAPDAGYRLVPVLVLTLLFGPAGLLCYLAMRSSLQGVDLA
jgi:hypothetical protein